MDFGISFKLLLIGLAALLFIKPEDLPRVARTVGTLLGKAQRYVADVKAEVNRSMDLDELKKMKESVESAARDVQSAVHTTSQDFEKQWAQATTGINGAAGDSPHPSDPYADAVAAWQPPPEYKHPGKKWRVKRGAVPQWYKSRQGVRRHVQSAAARVARHRPKRPT